MPERQEVDETSLLQQAQQGDTEAFGQIYEMYSPLVFRFLFAHLDNRLDAEDLTEEVFLRAWQSLPGYRMRGVPFKGFLFGWRVMLFTITTAARASEPTIRGWIRSWWMIYSPTPP